MRKHVVTGAFSFTGRFIAEELLRRGFSVGTLTRQPDDLSPLRTRVEVYPFNFDRPEELARSLQGADVLYNTYWVRFNRDGNGFDLAIRNTAILLEAARKAGVRKFIHISVSNPSVASPLDYYRGKAILEERLKESGMPYAIIRPTLVYGSGDLLLNNIAWFLRHIPIFFVPGNGAYRVQPVAAEDVARLAIDAADEGENKTVTAAGPQTYRFDDLVRMMALQIGSRARILHAPASWVALACRPLGWCLHDVVLTPQEIHGLMANLLVSGEPPTGSARFKDWLASNRNELGQEYRSELRRNFIPYR